MGKLTTTKLAARVEELELLGFDECTVGGKAVRVRCSQCSALCVNGVACHEAGCPNAARAARCVCPECGARHADEEDAGRCCTPDDDHEALMAEQADADRFDDE